MRRRAMWGRTWPSGLSLGLGLAAVATLLPLPARAHPGHANPFLADLLHQPLTPGWIAAGLGLAFLFGAGHALAPGHGKTLVAAYLVGSRGTPQQALLLALVTTLTHTVGVFALGLMALAASQYILPEQLYPILSLASGLTVCGVGFWLLDQRLSAQSARLRQAHGHSHVHSPDHPHPPGTPHSHGSAHSHSHLPTGPITPRSLVALGIAGGIVPCPSALVLLLSAISLGKIGFGLLLLSGFSLGLAMVLVGIGWMTLYARDWLNRLPAAGRLGRVLPLLSAVAVIGIGGIMTTVAVIAPLR